MNIFNKFMHSPGVVSRGEIFGDITADTTIDLTESGQKLALNYDAISNELKILQAIQIAGFPQTLTEISRNTRLDINTVKKSTALLKNKRLITVDRQ